MGGNSADVPSPAVVDVQTIIDKVDKLYRSETSYSEIEMTIVNPNWERMLKVQMWSRGMEETFIRILSPKRDAGITTLRRDPRDVELFPEDRQSHESAAVDDDGFLDGLGLHERRSRQGEHFPRRLQLSSGSGR